MKVFISWSGDRSREVATVLRNELRAILRGLDAFLSSEDVISGKPWFEMIRRELSEDDFGLVCVTPENTRNAWLNFEAGGLACKFGAQVCCYLAGVSHDDLRASPLSNYHNRKANKEDTWRLVQDICQTAHEESLFRCSVLKPYFEHTFWPKLAKVVGRIEAAPTERRQDWSEHCGKVCSIVIPSNDSFNREVRLAAARFLAQRGIIMIDPFLDSKSEGEKFIPMMHNVVHQYPHFVLSVPPGGSQLNSPLFLDTLRRLVTGGTRVALIEGAPKDIQSFGGNVLCFTSDSTKGARVLSDYAAKELITSPAKVLVLGGPRRFLPGRRRKKEFARRLKKHGFDVCGGPQKLDQAIRCKMP